jgi:hypothetical protein
MSSDEATTGLDSASSQLLLKTLRHEALQGVSKCLCSYSSTKVSLKHLIINMLFILLSCKDLFDILFYSVEI